MKCKCETFQIFAFIYNTHKLFGCVEQMVWDSNSNTILNWQIEIAATKSFQAH